MKKIVMMLTIAVFATSFIACGGKSNTQSETATDESAAPQTEEVAPAAAEGDVLAKYEELINKAIELYPKVIAGDASASQEYVQIGQDISGIAQQLAQEAANFTEDQQKRYLELAQKFADVATNAANQQ
jgi:hypothetical protein